MLAAKKRALLVIALKGFQDAELAGTLSGLHNANYQVTLCGKEVEPNCVGKFGSKQSTEIAMRDVETDDFDRVAFIGGPGAKTLVEDKDAHDLAQEFVAAGKVVGAICIAPTILAASGVLEGKRATVFDAGKGEEIHFLQHTGKARFVPNTNVVVDLPIVTGNGPDSANEFGRVFASV